jgi:DNA (cytosine-5)-methyltransferase 1
MLYLIELFAGIGSQAKALKKLGIPFTHHRVVEWDKYAIKSYNAIHNTNFETSDITKIKGEDLGITETNKYNYLMTYSFPCQDLSKAGKGKGMTKGDNTRSGLLWEVERLLRECKELPQYLLMENVPDVIGQKNIKDFAMWCEFLESIGYRNFYQLLNAKDYGIPQNRNRCFMVSILKTKNQIFQFPKPIPLKLRLKDMLEDEVDEKYYLSETAIQYMFNTNYQQNKFKTRVQGEIASTLCIAIPEATKKGYALAKEGDGIYINRPHQKRGVVQKGMIQTLKTSGGDVGVVVLGNYSPSGHNASRIVDKNGLSPTVMENHGTVTAIQQSNLKIRKLTPKECWRLMGFSDEDFDKASKVNSNSQLYKQAGNSIVVNVLMEIFKKLFIDTSVDNYQTNLFDFI